MNLWPFSKKLSSGNAKQTYPVLNFPIPSATQAATQVVHHDNSSIAFDGAESESQPKEDNPLESWAPETHSADSFAIPDETQNPLMLEALMAPTEPSISVEDNDIDNFSPCLVDVPWQDCLAVSTPDDEQPPVLNKDVETENRLNDWSTLSTPDFLSDLVETVSMNTFSMTREGATDQAEQQEHDGDQEAFGIDVALLNSLDSEKDYALPKEEVDETIPKEDCSTEQAAEAIDLETELVCSLQSSMTWLFPEPGNTSSETTIISEDVIEENQSIPTEFSSVLDDTPGQHELYEHLVRLSIETFQGQARQTNRQINDLVNRYFSKTASLN